MSAGNSSGFVGDYEASTPGAEMNAMWFLINSITNKLSTATLVQVKAVDGATAMVDVLPLINQVDGNGANSTPHGIVNNIPFWRLQGQGGAVLDDPAVGDVGLMVTCDHDISAAVANKAQANPGSARRFDMADGIYIGGVAAFFAAPTQWLKFITEGGVELVSSDSMLVRAGTDAGDATFTSPKGNVTVSAPAGKATVSSDKVTTVSAKLVQLGPNGGNLYATAPPPAIVLLNSYSSSGPSVIFTNPTAAASATLTASLVPGTTIATGLQDLVDLAVITLTDKNNILAALGVTGGAGLQAANVALKAHTDRLSGLLAPTTAAQPFLAGVVGLGAGLDYLAGGLFGSAASMLPGMTTGLSAAATLTADDTYANGIVALLTLDPTQVAAVIAAVTAQTAALNAIASTDTAAYAAARNITTVCGNFLSFVSMAKNNIGAVEAVIAQVMSPSTVATLQSVT